jgi:hypothetical protein
VVDAACARIPVTRDAIGADGLLIVLPCGRKSPRRSAR